MRSISENNCVNVILTDINNISEFIFITNFPIHTIFQNFLFSLFGIGIALFSLLSGHNDSCSIMKLGTIGREEFYEEVYRHNSCVSAACFPADTERCSCRDMVFLHGRYLLRFFNIELLGSSRFSVGFILAFRFLESLEMDVPEWDAGWRRGWKCLARN